MEKVVIIVKGGMVQDVYSSNRFVDVEIVDQDTEDCPDLKDVVVPNYHIW